MIIMPKPGFMLDQPPVSDAPFWYTGMNMRFRVGLPETIGLFGPLRDILDAQLTLPGGDVYRTIFTTPSTTTGQVLAGSANAVQLIDYDPNSTPVTGTRWRQTPVTPAGLSAETDAVPNPSAGRVSIPPVWWFSDQDDVVVGGRANVGSDPAFAWDRNRTNDFVALANSPTGAVGGGIINRILVLLGCTSFTDPDPQRFMTIRWSDRFDFEDWTPTDVNISGELQLEGGSRIVGGGVTGFGVVAWTDKRMALLLENGDPTSVFERRYIDGGRGLLGNRSWCEADGQIWWYDEHRVLNVYDGGRPRQIINPLKYATIDRIDDEAAARSFLVPNPEYSEIILHYPDTGSGEVNAQVVYNYADDAWSPWRLSRSAWVNRFGVIPTLAIREDGTLWRHDLDTGIPTAYINGPVGTIPSAPSLLPAADVEPFDFFASTNLITMPDVSWRATRLMVNHVPLPANGAETDVFSALLTAYGDAQVTQTLTTSDQKDFLQGVNSKDFRAGGEAIQLTLLGSQVKTVFRFGQINATEAKGGVR